MALPAILISVFMIIVARPVATFLILSWFKTPVRQQLLVSWSGLRGAASIVFAIFVMSSGVVIEHDIFHIVFFVALFSVAVQGTLLPKIADKLGLVDKEDDSLVLKTFTDYQDDVDTKLLEVPVTEDDFYAGRLLREANIPEEVLIVMIKRHGETIIPRGSTKIKVGDILVVSSESFERFKSGQLKPPQ